MTRNRSNVILATLLLAAVVVGGYFVFGGGEEVPEESNLEINGRGELVYRGDEGEKILVSFAEGMEVVEDEVRFPGVADRISERTYTRGSVDSFEISPNGKYIAYQTLEGFIGCCGGPNDIPVYKIWIMKSDGRGKAVVEGLPGEDASGALTRYKGWYEDSSGIKIYFQEATDSAMSTGIYKVGLDGKILYQDPDEKTPFEEASRVQHSQE